MGIVLTIANFRTNESMNENRTHEGEFLIVFRTHTPKYIYKNSLKSYLSILF